MRILLSLIFTLSVSSVMAQNLVPNSGFDVNNGCPNQIGQIDKAVGWSVWGGTPDYFHSCSNLTNPIYGTPVNNRGFQVPHSGDAYIGLFTFSIFMPNGREFVGRPLLTPLAIGQSYHVSFWVNHADVAVLSHVTNHIGIRFSTVAFSLVNPDTALNNAHVFATSAISDTTNWIQITGTFTADSAYTHIGIGNYFSDANTIIIPGAPTSNYAYYLIDDICVVLNPNDCVIKSGINDSPIFQGLNIFPNPADGYFYISATNSFAGKVQVTEVTGKMIREENLQLQPGEKLLFETAGWSPGFYLVKITTDSHSVTKKILVK